MNQNQSVETILVLIPSYRDPDCRPTVNDLFEKASNPDCVSVAVFWQVNEQEDQHCFEFSCLRPERVREVKVAHLDARGPGWARGKALAMHAGEDYILQIDAHSRFRPGWDEQLIREYRTLLADGVKKPLISQLPAVLPEQGEPEWTRVNVMSAIAAEQNFSTFDRMPFPIRKPVQVPFCSGSFMFASSGFFLSVPGDPTLAYGFYDFNMALRAWTYGWDIFMLHEHLVAHRHQDPSNRKIFEDLPLLGNQIRSSRQRYDHLIGKAFSCNSSIIDQIEKYGLGNERDLKSFEQFAGITLVNSKTEIFSDMGLASCERILPSACGRMKSPEIRSETSAPPSSGHKLEHLLQNMGCKSILDIGCLLAEEVRNHNGASSYIGLHTDEKLLNRLARSHVHVPGHLFLKLFPCIGILPACDTVFLDVDQLSQDDCWYMLDLIRRTFARYFFVPYKPRRNHLCEGPYRFPEPEHIIRSDDRLLGFWPIDGFVRRFLAKEPELIRTIRTPLATQLSHDLQVLQKAIVPEKNFITFLQLWTKDGQQNNEAFIANGFDHYFANHQILHIHQHIFRLFYMSEYDKFLPEYGQFATEDPYLRHVQSYLTHEILYDYGLQNNLALKFGANMKSPSTFLNEIPESLE